MPMDFPLPIRDQPHEPHQPHESDNAWGLDRPEPTDLILLWPGEEPPTLAQTIAAMQRVVGSEGEITVLEETSAEELKSAVGERMRWKALIQLPQREEHFSVPIVIWVEPSRTLSPEETARLGADGVRWTLGVETLLWPPSAATHLIDLLCLLARAFPKSPAIYDVNKEGWFLREDLERDILPDSSVVTEAILWFVHAVCTDSPPNEHSTMWLYTYGLARCGAPELEILEVPYSMAGSAMMLLNAVAELIIEHGIPDPGERFEIGHDMAVTLHPWEQIAATIDPDLLGHVSNRKAHGETVLTGARAAVCAAEQRDRWKWPEEAVKRLAMHGDTVLYKTARATNRQAHLARRTWDELAAVCVAAPSLLHQRGPQRQAVVLIKAGFQKPQTKRPKHADHVEHVDSREHLWIEVDRYANADRSRVEGRLINDPLEIPHLHAGDVVKVDRELVSDWQVLTSRGIFGPNNIVGLQETLRTMTETNHA